MIKPLLLGNLSFPVNVIQGPLAGISCAPFRALTWRYSQPAFSCTEMISCKTLLHSPLKIQQRFIKKDLQEGPVCFQLAGNDPVELAEATRRVTDFGADLIDLNCGCPVKKIRHKGAGSRLLTEPANLYALIRAMKANTHVPVSIKIRVEGKKEKFHEDIAAMIGDAGADFLVVHGRHWTEHYETPCRYDDIQYFVETLKIPVIGNGDINDIASLQRMFHTGCAGVMIARAGVGQPWLIGQLIAHLRQEKFVWPTPAEMGSVFIEHVQRLIELLGSEKFAILQARQFAPYYARTLCDRKEFANEINGCEDLSALENITLKYFGCAGFNEASTLGGFP